MSSRLLTRMTAPVVAVSLLLLACASGAAWYVHRIQKRSSDLLASNVASILAARELEIGTREVRYQLDSYLITGEPKHLEAIPALQHSTDRSLEEVMRTATTDRDRESVARIRAGYDHFFAEMKRLTSQSPPWKLPAQIHTLIDTVLIEEILTPVHTYLTMNEEGLRRATTANEELADDLVLGLLLLGICGAGAGLAAGALFALSVRRSIVQIHVRLKDTAGQLNEVVGPITLTETGDLGGLDSALQRVTEPIGEVVRRLSQSQRDATRAEQLAVVGRMAAGVAHEVRNPLMAMKILVQAAAERGDGKLGGRGLRVLEEEIVRLERLTRTFLEFARPPRPEKHPVRVQQAVSQTLELLRPRAAGQNVRFDLKMPARPIFVEADSGQLHQLLFNLMQNALEASPAGGVVEVEASDSRPGQVQLRVSDSGAGLPADLGERIFEPFVSTKEAGLGLGLSICRQVAVAHGGSVTAANRPGGGAAFTVTFACLATAQGSDEGATDVELAGH
jgi:signal transduction histidine kinase